MACTMASLTGQGPDGERSHRRGAVADDHLVRQALNEAVADPAVDRAHQVDPSRRQGGGEQRDCRYAPGSQPAGPGIATHHLAVVGHIRGADLVHPGGTASDSSR